MTFNNSHVDEFSIVPSIELGFEPMKLTFSNSDMAAGFKAADSILLSWGCSNRQIQNVLNLSKQSFDKFKTNPEQISLSDEQLVKVSYILNIHSVLRVVFNNSDNVKGFMSMKNHNEFFLGRPPIQVIESGKLCDLQEVYRRIDILRRG